MLKPICRTLNKSITVYNGWKLKECLNQNLSRTTPIYWGLGLYKHNIIYHSIHFYSVSLDNCLQIMACSCIVLYKCVLFQCIFCSYRMRNCMRRRTAFFRLRFGERGLVHEHFALALWALRARLSHICESKQFISAFLWPTWMFTVTGALLSAQFLFSWVACSCSPFACSKLRKVFNSWHWKVGLLSFPFFYISLYPLQCWIFPVSTLSGRVQE